MRKFFAPFFCSISIELKLLNNTYSFPNLILSGFETKIDCFKFMETLKHIIMQIQINTDKNVEGSERLVNYYTTELEKELARFEDKITRIEVHFGDENSGKFGLNDKRCLIEIRLEKKQPIAVTDYSDTLEKSFYVALEKTKKVLNSTFEKMREY